MPTPEPSKGAWEAAEELERGALCPFLHDNLTLQARAELCNILAHFADRFAAQRGAEADREFIDPSDPKRCGVRPYCLTLKERDEFIVQKGLWAEFVGSLPMGPKGGGGDAGKRARELASIVIGGTHLCGHGNMALMCPICQAEKVCESLRAELSKAIAEIAALRSSHREGAEAISDDMNAAHWHGYREGWIAGRDASAMAVMAPVYRGGHDPVVAIRALPIPGSKTDAG